MLEGLHGRRAGPPGRQDPSPPDRDLTLQTKEPAMSIPRRRLLRPAPADDTQAHQRKQKLRERLAREQQVLSRWMSRLRRAFHSVEKQQRTVARIERRLRQEDT